MEIAQGRVQWDGCEEAVSAARGAVEAVLDRKGGQEEARLP
jgi:hypothetical protein